MAKGSGKKSPFGRKQIKALYATYSDDDLYNSGNFNPYTRNLTTGKILKRGHHCEQCNAKMTHACYDNFHHAFCPAWVTRIRDGKRVRERCGERFALHSDGCGKHPRVQGYNQALYRAAEGYDVDLLEFDDTDPENLKGEPEDDHDVFEDHFQKHECLAEDIIAKDGCLPENFWENFWEERAKEKSIARSTKGAAAKPRQLEMISEDTEHELTAAGRGQANIYADGKTGAGKKTRKRTVTFADGPFGNNGQGGQVGLTYGANPAVLQPMDGNQKLSRSYAPKGSRPKAPMEVPRRPKNEKANNDPHKEKGKKRIGRWWDKMNGEEEKTGNR